MTDPDHPSTRPDHLDDGELDAFLARRGSVADAWREANEAPQAPASLDAPVLRLAAESIRADARETAARRRLRHWRIPLSAAATLVIAVGLVRLAMDDPSVRQQVLEVPSSAVSPSATGPVTETPTPMDDKARASSPPMQAPETPSNKPDPPRVGPPASSPIQSSAHSAIQSKRTPSTSAADAAPGLAGTISSPQRESEAMPAPASARVPAPVSVPPASPSPAPPPAGKSSLVETSVPPPDLANRPASKGAASALSLQRSAAEATATMSTSSRAFRTASDGPVPDWQPGSWQGLRLGTATRDDLQRRFGAAEVETTTLTDQPLADARRQHQLLRYEHRADARGIASIYIDAGSQVLASVSVELKPSLPLGRVLAQEGLTGLMPRVQIPASQPCTSAAVLPPGAVLDPARYPLNFVYADRGVILLLSSKDQVTEIAYYDRCD